RQSDLLDAMVTALGLKGMRKISANRLRPRTTRRPLRVLLTEDHPVNQRLAVKLLEKWGHTVAVACNGRRALEALEKEPFDLVLMDMQMPEMGGLEATRAIRAKEEFTNKRVPIIAMTAHAMKADREECARAGMDGYVAKPLDPQVLFDTIEDVHVTGEKVEGMFGEELESLLTPTLSPGPRCAGGSAEASGREWVGRTGEDKADQTKRHPPHPRDALRSVSQKSVPQPRLDREAILARVEGDTALL